MQDCKGCGRPYDESFADWSICRPCMQSQMEEHSEGPVYMDTLGICWSESDLEEAGGRAEVDALVAESQATRWESFKNK